MIEVLQDWNPWWKEEKNQVPNELLGIERQLISEIIQFLSLNRIITLVGIRRAGKSTILYQIISYLLKNNLAERKDILFINFDDIRFSSLSIDDWFQLYLEEMKPISKPHLFLDEIHNCANWVSFVRSLLDRKKANFFLTDSSSYLLPIELESLITGRKVTFEVFPLSFKEYLLFKNIKIDVFGSVESGIIRGYLKSYIQQGGFPELINLDWRVSKKILLEFFSDIISKDVVARFNVDNVKIRDFSYFLLSNPAQKISYRKLQSAFNLGSNIPQKYLKLLEEVFLCFSLQVYSIKVRKQKISPKKIYPIDTGLINAVSFKITENFGPLLELVVFIELKRRNLEVYYKDLDHSNYEIGFVIKKEDRIETIINVSYDIQNEKTRKREIKGLENGIIELQPSNCFLLTWHEENKIQLEKNKTIKIIPVWKWLLDIH